MPEFLQVMQLCALGNLGFERGIAARAADAGNKILALFLFGHGKELRGQGPCLINQCRIDAVILDQRKTIFAERRQSRGQNHPGCRTAKEREVWQDPWVVPCCNRR
jgi:hypothetical protein